MGRVTGLGAIRPSGPVKAGIRRCKVVTPFLAGIIVLLLTPASYGDAASDASDIVWQEAIEVASGDAYQGFWRMNRSQFYYVDDPAVDVGGNGSVGVVWVDNRGQNILFQKFDARSDPVLVAPVDVSRSGGTFSWLPKLAMSEDGESVFVLWQEIVFSGGSHGGEAFFSRSIDGGRTFSEPLNLSGSLAGDGKGRLTERYWHNGSLDLARGQDGALFAAWTEYEGALWFRRSSDGGRHFDEPVRVAGSDEAPARGPDFGIGPDGTVYLAWAVGEDSAADIHLVVSRDGGRSFSESSALFPGPGHSDAPKIVVGEDGAVHLVYAESPSGMFGQYHVRYARLAPDGTVSQASRRIDGSDAGGLRSAHFPALAVHRDSVYVIWERFPAGERRPRGLGFTLSPNGGQTFEFPSVVPGTDDRTLGSNGGLQGLLMQKIAVNDTGDITVVNSRFDPDVASRVRLIRGRVAER